MRIAIDRRVGESRGRFRIIPVLLPGAERGERSRLPDFLVRATWVEFRRTLDDETAWHRLVAGIRGREPGPVPNPAILRANVRIAVCNTSTWRTRPSSSAVRR